MISEGPVKQTLKTSIILKQGNLNDPRLQGTVDFGSNFVSGYLEKKKKVSIKKQKVTIPICLSVA